MLVASARESPVRIKKAIAMSRSASKRRASPDPTEETDDSPARSRKTMRFQTDNMHMFAGQWSGLMWMQARSGKACQKSRGCGWLGMHPPMKRSFTKSGPTITVGTMRLWKMRVHPKVEKLIYTLTFILILHYHLPS